MTIMKMRGKRRESRTVVHKFRSAKLQPVMATCFRGSESGTYSNQIFAELDPIAGRMVTPVTAQIQVVAVPLQSIYGYTNPSVEYSGTDEFMRKRFLSGAAVFVPEVETEISKGCGVIPASYNGTPKITNAVRLGHNAAVQYLRKRKYEAAVELSPSNNIVTPALIGQTVLKRLNAVLDPEDRVNGAVDLDVANITLPVKGIGKETSVYLDGNQSVIETDGANEVYAKAAQIWDHTTNNRTYIEEDPNNPGSPNIRAESDNVEIGTLSLTDFYQAEKMDKLVREMREIYESNPQYGDEVLANYAHGLKIDTLQQPIILHEVERIFGGDLRYGQDGPNLGTSQTDLRLDYSFTVPVPPSEFGFMIYTFVTVKPDETLASQPHPFLSKGWAATNYVADELAIDPVGVKKRELHADISAAEEDQVALYIGNNGLQKTYINYGLSRATDPNSVASKTAIWQLEIPISVSPDNILYPQPFPQYPFADQNADICTLTVRETAIINTPIIFGPTPVENTEILDPNEFFE